MLLRAGFLSVFRDILMGSKCELQQSERFPSHLSVALGQETAQMSFRGKVDSTSIFHGTP